MPRVTVTVPGKQAQPYRFPLDREKATLGRGSDNDIAMASGSVSVHHAIMVRVPGGFELRDLDSTNGITYHGEKRIFLPLQSGMSVKMGEVSFDFLLNPEEEEALAKELQPDRHESEAHPDPQPEPAPDAAAPVASPPVGIARSAPAPTNGMISVFVLLALIAFVVGMALRYQGETGKPFLENLLAR